MNKIVSLVIAGLFFFGSASCEIERNEFRKAPLVKGSTSQVSRTDADELILMEEVSFAAPVEEVWRAYTTADGWIAWASPKAEIDLRVGGTIRTAYQGEIGGSNTNTLHIVNYVPERLLTLRAEPSKSWPEIMLVDAERLSNVILFEETEEGITRIQSFGIGYSDAPEYDQLMGFFIKANEGLYENLRAYLETGARIDWSQ